MNNIFKAKRFGMLFIKHTSEHYKAYLMSLLVLTGVMLLGGCFLVYMIETPLDIGLQTAMFGSIYFLAGTIFTSTIFADFGDQKKAISALTLPASNLEKFMVGWVYSYLIFSVVFNAAFYLILIILINRQQVPNPPREIINVFAGQQPMIFVDFALFHSVTIFGAVYFKKLHFIKTAFCFFISISVATLVNTIFLGLLFGHSIRQAVPFSYVLVMEDNATPIDGSSASATMVMWLLIIVALMFWVAAYYRLKEKQV